MQESHISFRAPSDLVDALNAAAERSGISQSELIRQALQARLRKEASSAAFDPFGKLAAAARGDVEAQRALANAAVDAVMNGSDRDPIVTLSEGLVFARMAATHGHVADEGLCISMLALLVRIAGDDSCPDQIAEATARIARVADGEGHFAEFAAAELPGLMAMLSPETVPFVKQYEARLQGGDAA